MDPTSAVNEDVCVFPGSSLSTDSGVSEADSFSLDVESNVRFSVWVSFCEIYNDNIHDLLEQVTLLHTHTHTEFALNRR